MAVDIEDKKIIISDKELQTKMELIKNQDNNTD
jgi:hypothetical protein